MIDTDKYEGHLASEGSEKQPWCWSKWMINNAMTGEQYEATSELLLDAPLLLAEVKRLREENKMLRHGINDAISMGSSGAKTSVADGSIKHYFPLYLLEMIE